MNPWLSMALVAGTLGALMIGLRLFQRACSPHPELVRKLLHMGMGLLTLSFPWLFDRVWPILVLGVLSGGAMLGMRLVKGLRSSLGCVVAGVSRMTLGEVYFPISVAILFLLYLFIPDETPERRLLLYVIPILLLTLADAMAALIGVRYGQARYPTSDGHKSMEGSLAFFLVGFFCAHIPLLLMTGDGDVGRLETLLIAFLLAWVAMMFEAISWAGLDNLALPLVSYLLLKTYLTLDATHLAIRLAVTAALTLFAVVYCRRSTLIGSAIFGVVLVGYICWALGGPEWVLPPLILFLGYTLLSPRTTVNEQRIHNIHAVVCVSSAGLVWLFLARTLDRPGFLFLFTLSFACHLAIIGIARLGYDYPQMSALTLLTVCVVKAWLFLFVPYLLMKWFEGSAIVETACALPCVALAALGFFALQPDVHDCTVDTPRWLRQATCAGLASAAGLVVLLF